MPSECDPSCCHGNGSYSRPPWVGHVSLGSFRGPSARLRAQPSRPVASRARVTDPPPAIGERKTEDQIDSCARPKLLPARHGHLALLPPGVSTRALETARVTKLTSRAPPSEICCRCCHPAGSQRTELSRRTEVGCACCVFFTVVVFSFKNVLN